MTAIKTETITVRIEPAVKGGLKALARQERRSLANMIEIMIRDRCDKAGVAIADLDPAIRRGTLGDLGHQDLAGQGGLEPHRPHPSAQARRSQVPVMLVIRLAALGQIRDRSERPFAFGSQAGNLGDKLRRILSRHLQVQNKAANSKSESPAEERE